MPRAIIIDTDPGIDDAVAILLALAAPELDVQGIVAVAGNVPLALTERNARSLVALAGRPELPVYAGCARPLGRALVTAADVHGDSGLGTLVLPPPPMPLAPQHGVDFLVDALMQAPPHSVTLCALGPLTNIAMALVKAPQIAERVRELVLMGGAATALGNITPAAEFNIYADPQAAALVLDSQMAITMIPLDATHQARTGVARVAAFRALGNRCGAAVATLLAPGAGANAEGEGLPLHDPCVIAYLLRPDLFAGRSVNVAVETASPLTLGMTVVDRRGVTGRTPNCRFIERVDAGGLFALLVEQIARLP